MNQDQPELTVEESIKQVMKTLPPVVRAYLAHGKYSVVAQKLMAKYGLHVDQGSILERELMLLLMGIENPNEFTQALTEEAKLNQQTIDGIVQDINAQVFIPLREEEMKSSQPSGTAAPGTAPKKFMRLDNRIPPRPPQPLRSSASITTPVPPRFVVSPSVVPQRSSALQPVRPVRPVMNVTSTPPMANEKLLEDHEEPHIEFNKASPTETPLRQALRTVMPSPNLPGAMQPRTPPPAPARPAAPPVPAKPYSADPYREPIEP